LGQIVATGRGEPRFERAKMVLHKAHPENMGVHISFDQNEARRMFAGSDFLLMPSRFEPWELSQTHAQRFGHCRSRT